MVMKCGNFDEFSAKYVFVLPKWIDHCNFLGKNYNFLGKFHFSPKILHLIKLFSNSIHPVFFCSNLHFMWALKANNYKILFIKFTCQIKIFNGIQKNRNGFIVIRKCMSASEFHFGNFFFKKKMQKIVQTFNESVLNKIRNKMECFS